jgi:hypothetical protein
MYPARIRAPSGTNVSGGCEDMNDEEREALDRRWDELNTELQGLHAGKVTPGIDPATRESDILAEMDEIELAFEIDDD